MKHQRGFAITRRDPPAEDYGAYFDRDMFDRDAGLPARAKGGAGDLALAALEIGLGALIAGLTVGRLNHWNIPGTPIPVGVAGAGVLVGADLLGWMPARVAPHTTRLGIGYGASWATMIGAGWGQQMRANAGETIAPITAGVSAPAFGPARHAGAPPRRPRRLTEAELVARMHER